MRIHGASGRGGRRARQLGAALAAGCALWWGGTRPVLASTGAQPAGEDSAAQIRLVLFVVVDQARADYLDRYRPLYESGLGRLLDESVRFTQAFHDHAIPKTAPGHATLISGAHPRRHGLIENEWVDRETGTEVEAVDDDGKASPRRLRVSTLGDWIERRDPRSKVFAISTKHRSAVVLGGHRADRAFWYDEDSGRITSSSFYDGAGLDALGRPAGYWSADRFFGRLWELTVDDERLDAVGARPVDWGDFPRGFPHSMGKATAGPNEDFYWQFARTPMDDELFGELAEALLLSQELGQDESVDLLAISFSSLDRVGHRYGPNSPELADTLARLDRVLGRLLDTLDREVGLEHVLVSLSSDHGIPPLPGQPREDGVKAAKLYGREIACLQRLNAKLEARYGQGPWVRWGPFFDERTLARHHLERAELEQAAREILESCTGVARVWTRGELSGAEPPPGELGRLFYNAFDPATSPDLLIQLEPYYVAFTSNPTTHLSPYEYDRHVPWLLRLPSGEAVTVDEPVATVDVAPTLAELLGLAPPGEIDGTSRVSLLPQ